uniref:DUF834 domain-containing protein n=1 Tax=Setaria digitata TaxID=48799 RepID=A0A915PWS1_9BILA
MDKGSGTRLIRWNRVDEGGEQGGYGGERGGQRKWNKVDTVEQGRRRRVDREVNRVDRVVNKVDRVEQVDEGDEPGGRRS